MTEKPGTPLDPEVDRAPRALVTTVIVLLVALLGVVSYLGYLMVAEPRYTSPGQIEIDAAKAAVRESPRDPGALLELAYAYQKAERFEDALDRYDEALSIVPVETAALYNKGVIYLETDREDEAEEALWAVLEINDEHVLAARTLGEYYAQRGHYKSLLEAVRPAAVANESSADLQYLMGLAYENLGREDWAEARYRLALKHYPDMQEARDGLERLGVTP